MDIKDFYQFRDKPGSSTFQAHAVGLKEFHPIDPNKRYVYDENRLIYGDYSGISFPVVFKQEYGKIIRDMLNTGWAALHLISDRIKCVLEDNGLTGWKTFPVKVFDKRNNEIKGYHGFSITGRCGKVDRSKGEIIEKRFVPEGPLVKYRKGLYIGLDKWDGSDFFIAEESRWIIVTSKAAEILRQNKFTNVRLDNLADIEIPVDY